MFPCNFTEQAQGKGILVEALYATLRESVEQPNGVKFRKFAG